MNAVNLVIRKARKEDFEWVENAMQNTLELYYGGDHQRRMRNAYLTRTLPAVLIVLVSFLLNSACLSQR